jgi:hypothetical protein
MICSDVELRRDIEISAFMHSFVTCNKNNVFFLKIFTLVKRLNYSVGLPAVTNE